MIDKLKQHLKENNINNIDEMQVYLQQKIDELNKTKNTNYTLASLLESIDMTPEAFYHELSKLFKNE